MVIEYSERGREISIEKVTPYHIEYKVNDRKEILNIEDIPNGQTYIDWDEEGNAEIKKHQ